MSRTGWRTLFAGILLWAGAVSALRPETIVYDGDLVERGAPASGFYDFRFRLLDAPDADSASLPGGIVEIEDVEVWKGRFRVALDFGADLPGTAPAWLAIEVARADRLGGFTRLEPPQILDARAPDAVADNFPAGSIAFFDLAVCPVGWSELTAARGRTIVGLPAGGTVGGTQETPLANLEARRHLHSYSASVTTTPAGEHDHVWAQITQVGSDVQWTSYDPAGSMMLAFAWSNGIDNEGSGIYPLAGHPDTTYFTTRASNHTHEALITTALTDLGGATLPYLQLLVCRKD